MPHIFAVGDCTDRVNLTPVAIAEGLAFAETQFNGNPMPMAYANIPSAVFSQPPVGVVGLTETQALLRGPIYVYVTRFRPMRHTITGRDDSDYRRRSPLGAIRGRPPCRGTGGRLALESVAAFRRIQPRFAAEYADNRPTYLKTAAVGAKATHSRPVP